MFTWSNPPQVTGNAQSKPWGLSVRALITDAAGRCLLLRRTPGARHFAGQWDLPGGKVEPDEPLDRGLRREVREETGLEVEPLEVAGASSFELPKLHVVDVVFRVAVTAGTLRLSSEHSEACWCGPLELAGFDLAPPARGWLKNRRAA